MSIYRLKPLIPLSILTVLSLSCTDDDNRGPYDPNYVPKTAYEYFVDISAIPRCTYNETAASDHLLDFGLKLGLETHRDEKFNVLLRKKGSEGREFEQPVVLQAHTDMVCRKDTGVEHDFYRDPIVPVINDGWVTASKRTTLGADNGGGVAMIMAALASKEISHPPIEALFTTEEETGFFGADHFDVSLFRGKRLINLDWTDEGVIIISGTRSGDTAYAIPMEPQALARIAAFPDWPHREDSPLRTAAVEVFREFYGYDPIVAQINLNRAAVESVIFAAKDPDMDAISFGPDIPDIHTPDERMSLSSFNRVYEYLILLLGAL